MKKILFFVATLLVGTFALTSCSTSTPKAAAEKYLTSFYHMDYEEAKKYATEETKKQLDMMAQLSGMVGGDTARQEAKKAVVDIQDVKEDGDNATVTYTVKPNGKEAAAGTQTLKMVKEKGKWLASWSKQDMMGGMNEPGMEGADPNAMPMDTTAPMTTDTAMTPMP